MYIYFTTMKYILIYIPFRCDLNLSSHVRFDINLHIYSTYIYVCTPLLYAHKYKLLLLFFSYSRLLAQYPYVILGIVSIIATTCLVVIVTIAEKPDFEDPKLVRSVGEWCIKEVHCLSLSLPLSLFVSLSVLFLHCAGGLHSPTQHIILVTRVSPPLPHAIWSPILASFHY